MLRLEQQLRFLHQRQEGFLQHILGFAVAQAQRPAIND